MLANDDAAWPAGSLRLHPDLHTVYVSTCVHVYLVQREKSALFAVRCTRFVRARPRPARWWDLPTSEAPPSKQQQPLQLKGAGSVSNGAACRASDGWCIIKSSQGLPPRPIQQLAILLSGASLVACTLSNYIICLFGVDPGLAISSRPSSITHPNTHTSRPGSPS